MEVCAEPIGAFFFRSSVSCSSKVDNNSEASYCLTLRTGSGLPILERFCRDPHDVFPLPDVSPENDGSLKLEYDGSFGGPLRKERTHEAVEIL